MFDLLRIRALWIHDWKHRQFIPGEAWLWEVCSDLAGLSGLRWHVAVYRVLFRSFVCIQDIHILVLYWLVELSSVLQLVVVGLIYLLFFKTHLTYNQLLLEFFTSQLQSIHVDIGHADQTLVGVAFISFILWGTGTDARSPALDLYIIIFIIHAFMLINNFINIFVKNL